MHLFHWPPHIRFDDTESDIAEARRVWLDRHAQPAPPDCISDFLGFIEAYSQQLERRRRRAEERDMSA